MTRLIDSVRAAAFDLDGTLIDTAPDLARAANAMLETLGYRSVAEHRFAKLIGAGVEQFIRKTLMEGTGEAPSDALLRSAEALFGRLYGERLFESSRVYPGVVETLRALDYAGIAMCCVTNKHSVFAMPLLEAARLREFFAFTLCADDAAERKPKPDLLLAACTHLAVEPAEMLYVGDSRTDAVAAVAAGCRVILVDYGYDSGPSFAAAKADAIVGSLTEIVTIPAQP